MEEKIETVLKMVKEKYPSGLLSEFTIEEKWGYNAAINDVLDLIRNEEEKRKAS